MIRKIGLLLAIGMALVVVIIIFQRWRMAGLDLLPIDIPWC